MEKNSIGKKGFYRVGQKNRVHFVLRPITLEILNRSLLNLAEITVFSFWTSLSWFIWINLGK